MDLLNTIKTVDTVIKIATPIIEGVITKLAPEMKNFAERLYTLSEKYPSLEQWAEIIKKSAEILTDVLFVLGINCDQADELGWKAEKAEKNMSDFESVEAYINFLHDEVEIDKEKFASLSDEAKMAYCTIGLAIEADAVNEKIGVNISPEFVTLLSKIKSLGKIVVETAEIVTLLNSLKEKNIDDSNDVYEYFAGAGESDRIRTGSILKEIFTELFNDKANDIIEDIKMQERNK